MSSQARKDAHLSAIVREKEAQDRNLDNGNFPGALGYHRGFFFENGSGLPRPTRVTGQGRVWVFNG
jgi:hypothetical protein